MPKLYTVEATVHKTIGNGFRVKVSFQELGMYINGVMVFPPSEDHKEWSVLTPSRPAGRGKYARIVEFNKKLPLWEEVHEACVDAVKADPDFTPISSKDVIVEEIDDAPLDLSDFVF